MMVSTGPAARIPAEAPKYADALLAREAPELRQTEFAVGPVLCVAPRLLAGWAEVRASTGSVPAAPLRNERFLYDGKVVVSADDAIDNLELVSWHDENRVGWPRTLVYSSRDRRILSTQVGSLHSQMNCA